jgi:hypothetical protein
MVTIQNLEVQFDVEGDSDEAVFARLFNRYIKVWRRQQRDEETEQRRSEKDRSLGNRSGGDN